jgi:hypothetical protein
MLLDGATCCYTAPFPYDNDTASAIDNLSFPDPSPPPTRVESSPPPNHVFGSLSPFPSFSPTISNSPSPTSSRTSSVTPSPTPSSSIVVIPEMQSEDSNAVWLCADVVNRMERIEMEDGGAQEACNEMKIKTAANVNTEEICGVHAIRKLSCVLHFISLHFTCVCISIPFGFVASFSFPFFGHTTIVDVSSFSLSFHFVCLCLCRLLVDFSKAITHGACAQSFAPTILACSINSICSSTHTSFQTLLNVKKTATPNLLWHVRYRQVVLGRLAALFENVPALVRGSAIAGSYPISNCLVDMMDVAANVDWLVGLEPSDSKLHLNLVDKVRSQTSSFHFI